MTRGQAHLQIPIWCSQYETSDDLHTRKLEQTLDTIEATQFSIEQASNEGSLNKLAT